MIFAFFAGFSPRSFDRICSIACPGLPQGESHIAPGSNGKEA
jgi:hypothetical protein